MCEDKAIKPCKKCGSVERYEKNGKCVPCRIALNAKNNAKRKKEDRAESYASNRPLFKGDAFEVNAIKRAGTVYTLGSKDQQLLVQQLKEFIKEINGVGKGSQSQWTLDHYVPLVGETIQGIRKVGKTTIENLYVNSVADNRSKRNEMPSSYNESQYININTNDLVVFQTVAHVRSKVMTELKYALNTPVKFDRSVSVVDALEIEQEENVRKGSYPNKPPMTLLEAHQQILQFLYHKANTTPWLLNKDVADAAVCMFSEDGYTYGVVGLESQHHESYIEDVKMIQAGEISAYWNKRKAAFQKGIPNQ